MDAKDMVFGTVGGLGLFLFGMGMLSDGLKAAAGNRLRSMLAKITKFRWMGMGVGAGVTCLIQSSSATTVIVVGLVHAGMLGLQQAICVVVGANIGTTFTAWLVASMSVFKITSYAMPAIGLGFLLSVFGRQMKIRNWGKILLGFGILFVGIGFMQEAFKGLKDNPDVQEILISIGGKEGWSLLAGVVVTMLVQSSSASIAMVQTLAFSGAFGGDWNVALRVSIPFLLGSNIGTTITAQLAALRTNLAGRRTAMAHTLFNVVGVLVVMPLVLFGLYDMLVRWASPVGLTQKTIMVHMALAHSIFNVTAAVVVLPLVGMLEKLVLLILPSRGEDDEDTRPAVLEEHLLDTPALAIAQAHKEMLRMAKVTRKAVRDAIAVVGDGNLARAKKVQEKEDAVDDFQTHITHYLVELSQRQLSPRMSNQLPVLLHSVNDLERISDHAMNMVEIGARKKDNKHRFSKAATQELEGMYDEVRKMLKAIVTALETFDEDEARRVLEHEETINRMQTELRGSNVKRQRSGECKAMAGLIFVDLVDNLEKIGDHLTNIAQGILVGMQWVNGAEYGPSQHPATPAGL